MDQKPEGSLQETLTQFALKALGLRDETTLGHSYRVSELCVRLGQALGLSAAELESLRIGGLLHDIGKIGISDEVLFKPGPLSGDEWRQVRLHPALGAELLKNVAGFETIVPIVEFHHEHWDGDGYPRGLKGEQIPLLACICAVAEAYDGMISQQVYKPLWAEVDVLTMMEHNAGKSFAPQVVGALKRLAIDLIPRRCVMRFGIMAMQLDALVPPGIPGEQVMANLMGFDHAQLVWNLYQQGFNPIELGGDLSLFLPHTFGPEAIAALKGLQPQGVGYTLHLPLWSVEPSTPLFPVRRGSVEAVVQSIQATQPLNPEVYVLHATGALAAEFYNMKISEVARALILRQFQNGASESIRSILAETGIPSRRLAVETIEFPLDLTLELAEEFDLSICLDTGHVLAGFPGWLDFFEVVEKCLPRLAEVHLHDSRQMPPGVRGYGEDHQPLGHGDLDLKRFLARLESAQFQGPFVFELKISEALESLKMVRALA